MTVTDTHFPIALDIVGVVVGALQGGFFARSQTRVSVVGVAVFAYVTTLGGAMIRDALIARPSAALSSSYMIAWGGATAAALIIWHFEHRLTLFLTVLDAVYLGVWAVAGSDKAIHLGFGIPAVIVLGVITAVGGGLIRDLLARQTPTILQDGPLYTVAALIGAIVFVVLHHSGLPRPLDALIGVGATIASRLLSLRYQWLLPAVYRSSPWPSGTAGDDHAGAEGSPTTPSSNGPRATESKVPPQGP